MAKIKKGDIVQILLGRDRGKSGKVERVFSKKGQVLVEGVNVVKRHIKKGVAKGEGGIVDIIKPIPLSNVALICPNCQQTSRVGFKILGKGSLRICKKCKKEIS